MAPVRRHPKNMRRITIDSLLASPQELRTLRELLAHGGVAAIPTETFYALGASPVNEAGVRRIFQTKGRDDGKGLPVLFGMRSQRDALGVAASPDRLDHSLRIWPAPLPVALPLRAP